MTVWIMWGLTVGNILLFMQIWSMHRHFIDVLNDVNEVMKLSKSAHNHLTQSQSLERFERVVAELREELKKNQAGECSNPSERS